MRSKIASHVRVERCRSTEPLFGKSSNESLWLRIWRHPIDSELSASKLCSHGSEASAICPSVVLSHGIGCIDVYEEPKRIEKGAKHLVEPNEVQLSAHDRGAPLERLNRKIVGLHGFTGMLGWNVKNDVRPLR